MKQLQTICSDPIPKGLKALESLEIRHKEVISVEQMKDVVEKNMEALL